MIEKHILLNGPHFESPQEGQELTGTFILGAIGNYFGTIITKHPVVCYYYSIFMLLHLHHPYEMLFP